MGTAERILVVDDEVEIGEMIKLRLSEEGYCVETVADGRQALAILASQTFDLIITDLMMPDMSGLDVLAEVKRRLPGAEVILITAHGSLDSAVEALRQGAHDYLTKPFSLGALVHSVQRTLAYSHLKQEKEELITKLQQQVDTRNALVKAGQRIATVLDQSEVVRTILEAALEVMPQVELAVIYYKSAETELKVMSLTGERVELETSFLDESLVDEVLRHKKTVYRPDWLPPEDFFRYLSPQAGEPGAGNPANMEKRSLIIEPLVLANVPLGALAVISRQPDAFDKDCSQLLTMLTTQAAIAIKNAQLYAEARRVDELEALHEAGQALNHSLDLQETLTTTLAITRSLTGAPIGNIYLYLAEHQRIRSVITLNGELLLSDADRRRSAEIARSILEDNHIDLHIEQNVTVVNSPTADRSADEKNNSGVVQSWLAVPLVRAGNAPVGVLELGSNKSNAFTADDVRLVRVIAAQATTAIENARLYEEVRQRLQQTEALNVISQSISNTLDLRRVLELVVDSAIRTLPVAAYSTLYLLDEVHHRFVLEAQASRHNRPAPPELEPVRARAIQQVTTQSRPLRMGWHNKKDAPWSLMVAPLKVNESVIGAIMVESPHPDAFLSGDEILLHAFASHASIAIQNANLFRERSVAYQNLAHQQEEILRSHRTLQALFNGITDGLYIVDHDLRIVAINQAEIKRLNRTADTLIGRRCDASIWAEAAPMMSKIVLDTFETGSENNWISQIDTPRPGPFTDRDVRTYPIFLTPTSASSPQEEKGEVNQVIILAQDVSEKRQLQASLFRSANLAVVGRLASSIAHQINNPLTVIIANSQLMELDADPVSPDYPIIQHIVEAGTQIRQIVQNLLDFSTQDSYEWFETDVQATIEDALALVAHPLRKTNIEVVKEMNVFKPIIASASHLKLLWMNLLLNARDAILERKVEGTINIGTESIGADQIKVQIKDNGIGLLPEYQDQLFQPFFTTKSPGQGLGLGLYTCRMIVEYHQGQIRIENNQDSPGVTVSVILPFQLNSA